MSERKVLNKYFPPDFDPSKIPRRKMPKDKQQVVRLMAPFSMRCNSCGEYIYKGKKFNARKETVQGEEYYGIKIFRFYIKCPTCSSEVTFKTDPKNSDYTCEHGAQRNFEPWRATEDDGKEEVDRLDELEAEENNPMEALENKAIDSKREMDILDALQSIRSRNSRIDTAAKGDLDRVLDHVSNRAEVADPDEARKLREFAKQRTQEEEEDEEEIRRVFGRAYLDGVPDIELDEGGTTGSSSGSEPTTPRDDEDGPVASGSGSSSSAGAGAAAAAAKVAAVKRKLDAVEPTPASLLSEAQRAIVGNAGAGTMQPPKKKKGNNALAKKLGIQLKPKLGS
ncbi:hypothetical protein JCM8097_004072 [Rhodosporidiobolus ruineniae]